MSSALLNKLRRWDKLLQLVGKSNVLRNGVTAGLHGLVLCASPVHVLWVHTVARLSAGVMPLRICYVQLMRLHA